MSNPNLDRQKLLEPEVNRVLVEFEKLGFTTTRGTNTYTLAQILVDYADRVLQERSTVLGYLNFWETENLSVVSRLAFLRYHIYNTRSSGNLYRAESDGYPGEKYSFGVYVAKNTIQQGNPLIKMLGNPKLLRVGEAIPLHVDYEQLLEGSHCSFGNQRTYDPDLQESKMHTDGSFIHEDYVILPDEYGRADLYLLKPLNIPEGSNNLRLVLYTKSASEDLLPLPQIRASLQVTPDFIRFSVTEKLKLIPHFSKMDEKTLRDYVLARYGVDTFIVGGKLYAPLDPTLISDLQSFVNLNSIKTYEVVQVENVHIGVKTNTAIRGDGWASGPENLQDQLRAVWLENKIEEVGVVEAFKLSEFFVLSDVFEIPSEIEYPCAYHLK